MAWFAPAIAGVREMSPSGAAVLWVLVVGHSVPSLMYVRERLARTKGAEPDSLPSILSHVVPFVVWCALVPQGFSPWFAAGAALLLGRCAWGLSPLSKPLKPAWIGATESMYALSWVIAVSIGT